MRGAKVSNRYMPANEQFVCQVQRRPEPSFLSK